MKIHLSPFVNRDGAVAKELGESYGLAVILQLDGGSTHP